MELSLEVGNSSREKHRRTVQLGHAKEMSFKVLNDPVWSPRRRMRSVHSFVFQGTEREGRQTPVTGCKWQGGSKVRKRAVCLQPAGKHKQLWDSVGQAVVEMAKGLGKAGSCQENPRLCVLG